MLVDIPVCDTWLLQRQTYSYLPSHTALLLLVGQCLFPVPLRVGGCRPEWLVRYQDGITHKWVEMVIHLSTDCNVTNTITTRPAAKWSIAVCFSCFLAIIYVNSTGWST